MLLLAKPKKHDKFKYKASFSLFTAKVEELEEKGPQQAAYFWIAADSVIGKFQVKVSGQSDKSEKTMTLAFASYALQSGCRLSCSCSIRGEERSKFLFDVRLSPPLTLTLLTAGKVRAAIKQLFSARPGSIRVF